MCLAVPGKLLTINDTLAEVDIDGTRVTADISLVPDAAVGDYVIVHAGMAIERYSEEDAVQTLALLRQINEAGAAT
jgi:hydrogenase expression/formation protein HypC